MKRLMILGAVLALAVARPELYKEKEDFQFSRSSTDDGSKSGYYGAQRGNMGGNYERAHNMDSLAQNQMSGLVQQVEGELGDGAKMRTGSVYTAANSRGTYGAGHYDLSNLAGRNFQEGASYGNSQSQSSHSASSAYNAAAYANSRSQSSRHNGYQATGQSGVNLQSDDLQALTDHSQRTGQYDYGRHTSQAAGYNAQSGFQQHTAYDASNANLQHTAYDASNTNLHSGVGYDSNVRLISATPVRVIVRPGGRVAIPVAAQTYDLTQGSTLVDQNSLNSDAEILSNNNQRTVYRVPVNAKHYESSYNYRKQWEKHDTIPSTVISPTTDSPFPKNSELYEDGQALVAGEQYDTRRGSSQRTHATYGGYNAAVKSTSGQSRYNYDTQRNSASHTNANVYSAGYGTNHQETSSDSSLNGYNLQSQYNAGRYHGASADALTQAAGHNTGFNAAADLNSQVENLNGKPKSYQSAYSYHKSWERQGDPYVIKPASSAYYDGQSAQRLTTGSTQNLGYLATGSHYQQSHASGADCDENGHIRVARSYNTDQFQDMQQQSQNLEDLGQQSQNLDDFGQQQSQNLENFGQQQQSQNLEDFGQQQSQKLEDFGQQQQSQNLEEFGQQQQNQNLDFYGQQQQSQKLEDLGKQQYKQNLEDLGQQIENIEPKAEVQWESQQEAGQQTQNTWDNLENLSQQTHNKWEDMQHTWDKFEDLGQKPQEHQNGLRQRPQDTETEIKNNTQDQQAQDKWGFNFKKQDEEQNAHELEQSSKFNQQETQPQLSDDEQSQKHKNDQMSVWDKFDLGSDQNIQQHEYNNEHKNSNGNPVNWSLISQQVGLDQQPLSSGINAESQSVYHNENNGSTEHITTTYEQSNSGSHIHDGNINIHTNQNQFWNNENSFQQTHELHESSNWHYSNSHTQQQTTNTDSNSHVSALDTSSPNTAPLAGLWDKLNNFEQTLVTDNVDEDEGSTFSQVHTNMQNSYGNSMHTYHNIDSTSQEQHNSQMKPLHDLMIAVVPINEKDTSQKKTNDTKTEKESALDVGRGDIGPEDLKPEKYPGNIPKISETVENQDGNSVSKNITNAYHNDQVAEHNENTHGQHYFHQHHDFHEQKDAENNEQQNLHVFSLHESTGKPNQHNVVQHNGQDYEESLEQQNQEVFTQQENKEQIFSDFGQQVNVEQQNLQDFGKPDNMEQQNLQDFGQQANVDQQNLQDFGKPDNMEQQNLQDFGQQVNVDQQNLQDFGKPDNMEQQNLQDFGQQANVEQQNLQDFGKPDNMEQQNLQDFGQQANVNQQNLQDFGKPDNMEQQNLQDFGQQANVEQQNLQDFEKTHNLEQQNLQDFGQQVNVEQENVQGSGKQDNLEQQNLRDFGQQTNVEQQNLQDFDKQDNLQQQNLQDFGQQENLEQQNVHGLDKQDNLEQQNLQDFGQQAYLEQHNLQHFRSQDGLQQQNTNLEQFNQDPNQPFKFPKEERTALPKNNVGSQTDLPPPEEIEQPIVKKQSNDLHSISAQTPSTEASLKETVTESTGFWKSIGNKLSRAKSKISSWF